MDWPLHYLIRASRLRKNKLMNKSAILQASKMSALCIASASLITWSGETVK